DLAVGATPAKFATDFRRFTGMSGADFAKLGNGTGIEVELPEDYPLDYLRRYLGRDPGSASERLKGNAFASGIRIGGAARMLTLHFAPGKVRVDVDLPVSYMGLVHGMVECRQGGVRGGGGFGVFARRCGVARRWECRERLRIHQTLTGFDGLRWTIIGQQIDLRFAFLLRTRLME